MRPIALALTVLFLSACGDESSGGPTFPERTVNLPDLSGAGTIEGVVRFEGTPPKVRRVGVMDAHCGGGPLLSEDAIVTGDRVANVVVFISKGLDGYTFPYEKTEVLLDQQGCRFIPHVLAVRAHQPVKIRNGDATPHNVNTTRSRTGQGFNLSLTQRGETRVRQFPNQELMIPVTCELHSWMKAYLHVFDHPYFTVTGEDGTFRLENVPPGTHRLSALHERFGRRDFDVTVAPDGTATVPERAFVFTK